MVFSLSRLHYGIPAAAGLVELLIGQVFFVAMQGLFHPSQRRYMHVLWREPFLLLLQRDPRNFWRKSFPYPKETANLLGHGESRIHLRQRSENLREALFHWLGGEVHCSGCQRIQRSPSHEEREEAHCLR